ALPQPLEGPRDLFRVESEASFRERLRQEASRDPNARPVEFPPDPTIPRHLFAGRSWPHHEAVVEPSYVCYGRLLFQQLNAERYGWDLGFIHPLVSLGIFSWDFVTLP